MLIYLWEWSVCHRSTAICISLGRYLGLHVHDKHCTCVITITCLLLIIATYLQSDYKATIHNLIYDEVPAHSTYLQEYYAIGSILSIHYFCNLKPDELNIILLIPTHPNA